MKHRPDPQRRSAPHLRAREALLIIALPVAALATLLPLIAGS